jgi:hypothetical protein
MKQILIISAALTLCAAAAHAATFEATQTGPINASATWGGATIPAPGNTDTWDTNGFNMDPLTSEQFHGGLLRVTGGSQLVGGNNLTTGLQATTFDGGGILQGVANFQTYDFNGKTLTFASGGASFDVAGANLRGIRIRNADWAGSGAITLNRTIDGADNSRLVIESTNTLSEYTGAISLIGLRTQLVIQAETTGSFGVNIGTQSLLHLSVPNPLTFASLVLGNDTIAPGTYTYDQFTSAQQALFSGIGVNAASITVIPEPAAIGLIFFCGLATIVIRRRLKA